MLFINLVAFVCVWLSSPEIRSVEKQPGIDPQTGHQRVLTVSKRTTYFDAPLTPDGFPDYLEALNLSRGQIKEEENAAIDLARIFGFGDLSDQYQNRYANGVAERLGLKTEIEPVFKQDYPEYLKHKVAMFDAQVGPLQQGKGKLGDQYVPTSAWLKEDNPDLYEWLQLEQTRLATQMLDGMLTKRVLFWPYVYERDEKMAYTTWRHLESSTPLMTPAIHCMKVVHLLTALAMLDLGEGRFEMASKRLLQAHTLASLIAKQPIESLGSMSIHEQVLPFDRLFANHPGVPLKLLESHHESLRLFRKSDHGFATAIRMMHIHELCHICYIARELSAGNESSIAEWKEMAFGSDEVKGHPDQYSIDLNGTVEALNLRYRFLEVTDEMTEKEIIEHLFQQDKVMEEKFPVWRFARRILAISPEQIGPWLRGVYMELSISIWYLQVVHRIFAQEQQYLTDLELTETVFVLERYRHQYGSYPETLDALVGTYCNELPKDRFKGDPFSYHLIDGAYELSSKASFSFPPRDNSIRFSSSGRKNETTNNVR